MLTVTLNVMKDFLNKKSMKQVQNQMQKLKSAIQTSKQKILKNVAITFLSVLGTYKSYKRM